MGTLSVSVRRNPDPLVCDDFGYGLGPPSGILVLRYAVTEATIVSDRRDDLLHQLYWSPDGVLVVNGGQTVDPDQGYWAHRARSHEVRATGPGTVYRACLRQLPRALVMLTAGLVRVDDEASRHLTLLGTGAVRDDDWRRSRRRLMDGLTPLTRDAATTASAPGAPTGAAAEVVRAIVADPGDPRTLTDFAADLHLSVKTLQRDFDRAYGMTFTRWRTRARLAAARDLLRVAPVGEVARRVGYTSTSAFVAAFTREQGCTPGAFAARPVTELA